MKIWYKASSAAAGYLKRYNTRVIHHCVTTTVITTLSMMVYLHLLQGKVTLFFNEDVKRFRVEETFIKNFSSTFSSKLSTIWLMRLKFRGTRKLFKSIILSVLVELMKYRPWNHFCQKSHFIQGVIPTFLIDIKFFWIFLVPHFDNVNEWTIFPSIFIFL